MYSYQVLYEKHGPRKKVLTVEENYVAGNINQIWKYASEFSLHADYEIVAIIRRAPIVVTLTK